MVGIAKIVGGVVLIILGIGAFGITTYVNGMVIQGVEPCSTFLGQLGQTKVWKVQVNIGSKPVQKTFKK